MTKRISKSAVALIVFAALLLTAAVGGTAAYLIRQADPVKNTFQPAKVTCAVEEQFAEDVKSDVTVRNTGNINAYIRAAILVNWIAEDGSGNVYSKTPAAGVDYAISWGNGAWHLGADGFWYYADPVAPDALTTNLINTATQLSTPPEGYRLSIRILASAIQSEPANVVAQQWNVTNTNGQILPN